MDYLVSALEMAELDRQTTEELGVPSRTLMEVAGREVAHAVAARVAPGARVAVACGPGNNGGDGFVAARALAAKGYRVRVFVFAERARLKGDAKAAFTALEKSGESELQLVDDARALWDFASYVKGVDLCVDALLGTGVQDEVRGQLGDAIDALNESGRPVVAVDIPSGINADTGVVLGRAVHAVHTVTFGFAKRGHYLFPGAAHRGELGVVDIGIPRVLAERLGVVGRLLGRHNGEGLLPRRAADTHKGTYGHVVVVAGAPATPGAAVLALQGALRAGAGLVSWATDDATLSRAPARPAEVMLRLRTQRDPDWWASQVLDGATALVVGPGFATDPERTADFAALMRMATVPVCIDADGLTILSRHTEIWETVLAPLVVTPHPKEMARLMSATVEDVQRDRFAAALQLAMARSCVVILKGAGTLVADPEGRVVLVDAGNPGMASGGTGDVLAGVVGGLLAQGIDVADAARAAALLHARAGDIAAAKHGQAGLRAHDLVECMGDVFVEWGR